MRKLSLKELQRKSVPEFKAAPKTPITLVLDNIRSGRNVGSAFRTADAFALEQVLLCGISAQPPHREILKTAIGATEAVDWTYETEVGKAVQSLKDQGYLILGLEQTDKSVLLSDYKLPTNPPPIALIFGNEVKGLSEEVLPLVDHCLEIPQFGTKHSINVSVCVGIAVWEIFKQLND